MNSSQNMNKIKSLYVKHFKLFFGDMFLEYCTEAKMFVDGDIGFAFTFSGLYIEDGASKAPETFVASTRVHSITSGRLMSFQSVLLEPRDTMVFFFDFVNVVYKDNSHNRVGHYFNM
jgi:hypothetical protein